MLSNPIVLVVDDEPFIRRALTFVLNREGYQTAQAGDGVEALEKMRALKPRLVFLDIMMPRMDGFEVCAEARQDPEIRDMHIILLSAKSQEEDRIRGLSAGANEYMTKPFSPSQILDRVREVVGWPDPSPVAP